MLKNNKEKYKDLCAREDSIPIFSQPFWLDAVCREDNWDVILYEKDNCIIGALPYYVKKRYGLLYITQPKFTQNLGPWVKYPQNIKEDKKISFEKDVLNALIEKLEELPVTFFQQNLNFKITNWLPFYWKGYRQTTNYTYRINDIADPEEVLQQFHKSKKRDINFAKKQNLRIDYDMSAYDFYAYHKRVLAKQGKVISYDLSLLENIFDATSLNNCGRVIKILDAENNIHGVIFIIWDRESAYNLSTVFDPEFRKSMSSTLLFFETIKYASHYVNSFDFEGSMIESIENSYRKFATKQTPYCKIWKAYTKNPLLKILLEKKMS